jgi:hypothetical protein
VYQEEVLDRSVEKVVEKIDAPIRHLESRGKQLIKESVLALVIELPPHESDYDATRHCGKVKNRPEENLEPWDFVKGKRQKEWDKEADSDG